MNFWGAVYKYTYKNKGRISCSAAWTVGERGPNLTTPRYAVLGSQSSYVLPSELVTLSTHVIVAVS